MTLQTLTKLLIRLKGPIQTLPASHTDELQIKKNLTKELSNSEAIMTTLSGSLLKIISLYCVRVLKISKAYFKILLRYMRLLSC